MKRLISGQLLVSSFIGNIAILFHMLLKIEQVDLQYSRSKEDN